MSLLPSLKILWARVRGSFWFSSGLLEIENDSRFAVISRAKRKPGQKDPALLSHDCQVSFYLTWNWTEWITGSLPALNFKR